MKPPKIFTEESKTADAPRNYPKVDGNKPPPKMSKPPAAVRPEIAFVILISGVWREC